MHKFNEISLAHLLDLVREAVSATIWATSDPKFRDILSQGADISMLLGTIRSLWRTKPDHAAALTSAATGGQLTQSRAFASNFATEA